MEKGSKYKDMKQNSALSKKRRKTIIVSAIVVVIAVIAVIALITHKNNGPDATFTPPDGISKEKTIACIDETAKKIRLPDNWNDGLSIQAQLDYMGGNKQLLLCLYG